MRLSKRSIGVVITFLAALTIILGFYFLIALFSSETVEKKVLVGEYTQTGRLNFHATLKPNLLYEREEIDSDYVIYSALLDKMELLYNYSFSPSLERAFGNYSIVLLLTPVKGGWEKEIGVYSGEISASGLQLEIPLDWEMVLAIWKAIENETKYDFGEPNVKILINLKLEGSLFSKPLDVKFSQSSNITYGKVISFSELNKSRKEAIYDQISYVNMMNIFGLPVEIKNAKIAFGISFFGLITLLGVFMSLERRGLADYILSRERKSFERKFKRRIVSVLEVPEKSTEIRVLNLKELAKLSYELEKPILKSEQKFAVVDEDIIYVHDENSRKEINTLKNKR
ncbi:MAG: DUF5305 family protein [Archaeoglobaceae archaeon]